MFLIRSIFRLVFFSFRVPYCVGGVSRVHRVERGSVGAVSGGAVGSDFDVAGFTGYFRFYTGFSRLADTDDFFCFSLRECVFIDHVVVSRFLIGRCFSVCYTGGGYVLRISKVSF